MRKKNSLLSVALISLLSLTACGSSSTAETDDSATEVSEPDQANTNPRDGWVDVSGDERFAVKAKCLGSSLIIVGYYNGNLALQHGEASAECTQQ